MWKDKIKGFVVGGLIIGLLSNTALASSIQQKISVVYNNIKLYVDDNQITPKDAQGNIVEPFVYNGTTYLPVRAVSDALGKAVTWDGKNMAVYIGKHDSTEVKDYLSNLPYINKSDGDFGSVGAYIDKWNGNDNTGKFYNNGLSLSAFSYESTNSIEYNLDAKYNKLKAICVLSEETKSGQYVGNATINIYSDGNIINSTNITTGTLPIPIDLNIQGTLRLKVEIIGKTYGHINVGLVDAKLY